MLKIQFTDRRKPAMWLVDSVLSIGSDSGCDIVIDESGVDSVHVELVIQQDDILARNVSPSRSIFVNDIPVVKEQKLEAWDKVRIGSSELEIIDPLKERVEAPMQPPAQATVIRPTVSPWMLKAISSPLDGQYFSLNNGMVVGREDRSDIKLPYSYISRRHLKLLLTDGKLFVEDLNSSNGTFVNGEKVSKAELHNNDELRLDEFIFHVVGPDSNTATKPDSSNQTKTKTKPQPKEVIQASKPKKKVMANQKAYLHGMSDDVYGEVFEITKAHNHISRLLGHHLSTEEISVSARHVYLTETEYGWEVKNDGAADGLLVNGKMQSKAVLQDDDELVVGGRKLKFQCVGNSPRSYDLPPLKSSNSGALWAGVVAVVVIGAAVGAYFSGIFS